MTLSDVDVVALTLWGEARGESLEGRIAVASVIGNRRASGKWGTTFTAVCRAPKQFSCWNGDDVNAKAVMALAQRIMAGEQPTDPLLRECYWIADGLVGQKFASTVKNALHYYATWMPKPPKWAAGGKEVRIVGQHRFLEGVA